MTRDWKEQSYCQECIICRDRHTAPRPPLQQQDPLTPLWKVQQGLHPLEAQRGHPAVCNYAVLANTLQFHLNFTWHSFPTSFVYLCTYHCHAPLPPVRGEVGQRSGLHALLYQRISPRGWGLYDSVNVRVFLTYGVTAHAQFATVILAPHGVCSLNKLCRTRVNVEFLSALRPRWVILYQIGTCKTGSCVHGRS